MSEQNLNQYEPGNGNNSGQGDPGNKGNEAETAPVAVEKIPNARALSCS